MFFLLREQLRNQQRTALNFKVARTFHCSHLLEQCFDRLVTAVRSELHLKKSLHTVKDRHASTLVKKTFQVWYCQYASMASKESAVVSKTKRKALFQAFLGWKAHWAKKNKLNFQSATLIEHKNGDCLKKVFAAWQNFSRSESKNRQMKAFSRFFFLQKILVSTLNTMRQNVRLSKVERLLQQRKRHLVAVKCFEALKTHNLNEKKTRWFQVMVLLPTKCTSVFREWSAFAFKRKRNREIQTFFETRRELSVKEGIFQAVKNCRVIDLQYKQIFYKRRLLLAWRKVAQKRAELHRKSAVVEQNTFMIAKFKALQAWRQELFLNFAEKRVAIPFFEALKIKQAWTALKEHSALEKQLARFNCRRLRRKTLSAFILFAQQQHNLRVFRAVTAFKQQKRILLSFAAVIRKRKVLQSITGVLQSRTIVKHLKRRVFNHWLELFHDNAILKPLENAIQVEVRQKNLYKTAFAGLKAYFRIKEGKKQMRQSVDNYYQEMLLERSFRQMQVFAEICQEKRELSSSAADFANHSLKKRGFQCLLEAFYLEQKNEMHLEYTARRYLISATLKKVWGCLRANVVLEFNETLASETGQQAAQFSDRVLKIKALKLLMLNVLTSKYQQRVQKVIVRGSRDKVQSLLMSLASKKAQQNFKNKASRNRGSATKTKAIRKTRSKALARLSSAHSEYKAQMKIQKLICCLSPSMVTTISEEQSATDRCPVVSIESSISYFEKPDKGHFILVESNDGSSAYSSMHDDLEKPLHQRQRVNLAALALSDKPLSPVTLSVKSFKSPTSSSGGKDTEGSGSGRQETHCLPMRDREAQDALSSHRSTRLRSAEHEEEQTLMPWQQFRSKSGQASRRKMDIWQN